MSTDRIFISAWLFGCVVVATCSGCGTSVQRGGSEQLLLSDAIDRSVDQLDLSPLADRRVFLDTKYMPPVNDKSFINAEYITSAIRQKMTTSGCIIVPDAANADYVLEPRVGAMGADSLEVTYGIPSSGGVGQAATALAGAPAVMAIPEMSFGKRKANVAISKVVVYAYHRETGVPVWQSGHAIARSDVQDSWLFGIGPVSRGSSYEGYRFAGRRLRMPFSSSNPSRAPKPLTVADSYHYVHPAVLEKQLAESKANSSEPGRIQPVSHTSGSPSGDSQQGDADRSANAEPGPPAPSVTPPTANLPDPDSAETSSGSSAPAAASPVSTATSPPGAGSSADARSSSQSDSTATAEITAGFSLPSKTVPSSPGTNKVPKDTSDGITAPLPWSGSGASERKPSPKR